MVYLKNTESKGCGVFTDSAIHENQLVYEMRERILPFSYSHTKSELDFLNHSCEANCRIKIGCGVLLIAIREINSDEELTINYNASYYDLGNTSFECKCGSKNCCGIVKGYKELDSVKRNLISKEILPYLQI